MPQESRSPDWRGDALSSVYLTFTLVFLFVINALNFAPVYLEEQIIGVIVTCFGIGYCAFRLRHGCRVSVLAFSARHGNLMGLA